LSAEGAGKLKHLHGQQLHTLPGCQSGRVGRWCKTHMVDNLKNQRMRIFNRYGSIPGSLLRMSYITKLYFDTKSASSGVAYCKMVW